MKIAGMVVFLGFALIAGALVWPNGGYKTDLANAEQADGAGDDDLEMAGGEVSLTDGETGAVADMPRRNGTDETREMLRVLNSRF